LSELSVLSTTTDEYINYQMQTHLIKHSVVFHSFRAFTKSNELMHMFVRQTDLIVKYKKARKKRVISKIG